MRIIAIAAACLLAACTPRPASDAAHGRRLASTLGCVSCHDATLAGHLFEEDPSFTLTWSANLSRILPRLTDAQITGVLRTGRRTDGSPLWFMPTFAQAHLSDADMRDLIAWLRTVPPTGREHPRMTIGPRFREAVRQGMQDSAAQAQRLVRRAPVDLGPATATGRYLARIACAECHGPDLTGPRDPRPGDPPDLSVAAAYTPADLARLLRTGVAPGNRRAGFMSEEGPKRFDRLTDAEIAALHAYLTARARH